MSYRVTMKAVIYKNYGQPDVLQQAELDIPKPKESEVLIRVAASTVNRTDCAMLTAKPAIMRLFCGLFTPNNPILGTEFVGTVEEAGSNVSKFSVGDKVFGFDDAGVRSYAQYLTFNENKGIAKTPVGYSLDEMAGSIEGMHYAHNFINKVDLKKGDKVMVNGATGAIGSAMVQLLKHYEVNITATANAKNIELVKGLGAEKIIDYTKEDFTQTEDKFDFVFDAVGKSTFGKCKHLLKPKGVYISTELGSGVQNPFLALITPLFGGRRVAFPFPSNVLKSINLIKKLMEENKYKPVVDKIYPLEETAVAFQYVLTGEKTGNVVIKID